MHCQSRIACGAALAALVLLAGPSVSAGVAPPEQGTIKPEDLDPKNFTAEKLFKVRWPEKRRVDPGSLAKCETCGRPLKDHVDGKVDCQAPNRRAAELGKERTRCPVCSLELNLPKPEPDPKGGLDQDFCRHPRGIYSLASEVWFCPKCGYAAPFGGFAARVDEKTRAFVRSTVTPSTMKYLEALVGFKPKNFKFKDFSFLDPVYVPEDFKYENALAVAGARLSAGPGAAEAGGPADLALARLHLGASHAYRRLVNRPFREAGLDKAIRRIEAMLVDPMLVEESDPVSVASAARTILKRADAKDAFRSEKLGRRERLYLLMRLAGLHDRLGEPWWAEYHLRQAWDLATKEDDARTREAYAGLVRNMAEFLQREAHHQVQAALRFRRALVSGETPKGERLVAAYLVGELLARTGELNRALPWLEEACRLATAGPAGKGGSPAGDWARFRIGSPAFYKGKGADRRLIAPDPEEKELVAKIASGLPVELPADGTAREDAARAGAPAAPAEGAAPPPSAVPEPGSAGAPVSPTRDSAPKSCREQMARIWRAIDAYRRARGAFPPGLDALVKAGLVSRGEAADFVCVESNARLFYRTPGAGGRVTFILFHSSPRSCSCKNMLLSDGSVVEFGKWQP